MSKTRTPDFPIEKGVPPPMTRVSIAGRLPFDKMEPGDSIVVQKEYAVAARAAITVYHRKHPDIEFVTRTLDDRSIRIWRLR